MCLKSLTSCCMLGKQNCHCRILNNSSQYRMIFFYFINSDLFIALSKHVLCEIGSQQSHPKLFLHEDHVWKQSLKIAMSLNVHSFILVSSSWGKPLQLEHFRVLGLSFMVAAGDSSNSLFSTPDKTSAAPKHMCNVEYVCLFFPLPLLLKRNSALEIHPPM